VRASWATVAALIAVRRDRWPLAGDQLYVDLDLSTANLPPGTRLAIGTALLAVSVEPHTGCRKFRERYGIDAVRFVGSAVGKALQLRGINAHVVRSGEVRCGDAVVKLLEGAA
jgi:MOSC domain-containing protein YiiM